VAVCTPLLREVACNLALLSRCRVVVLEKLEAAAVMEILAGLPMSYLITYERIDLGGQQPNVPDHLRNATSKPQTVT
jgi:hypothetical protein